MLDHALYLRFIQTLTGNDFDNKATALRKSCAQPCTVWPGAVPVL